MSHNPIETLLKDIDRYQAMLKDKDAEIQRLSESNEKFKTCLDASDNAYGLDVERFKKLITELADALEESVDDEDYPELELIKRAREAVR